MSNCLPENPITATDDQPVRSLETERLTWLKRQEAVVAVGRRAIAPPELSILMDDAAALIAELLDARHYAVAETLRNGSKLRVTLKLRQPDAAQPRAFSQEVSAAGNDSVAGYVLQAAYPITVSELSGESRFQDIFLRKHGIESLVAVPLILPDRSFGALIACDSESRRFETEDALFAETIAHLITTAIARRQAEEELVDHRRQTDGVLKTVKALVLELNSNGQIVRINRACEQVTGFSLADVKDRRIWDVLPVPKDVEAFRAIFQKLAEGGSLIECENSLLTKHSEQRTIAWSCAAMTGSDGSVKSIIATGIDVTEQRQAEEDSQKRQSASERQSSATRIERSAPPGTPVSAILADRRGRPRRSYPYHQSIAPIINGKLPARSELVRVQCNDIAAGGFSYLSDSPPPSDMLVVALGHSPNLTYVTAEIVHLTRVKRNGQNAYLVGCTYTGRAEY